MRKYLFACLLLLLFSCKGNQKTSDNNTLSVSIAPYKYIVEAIAGDDFTVNVMVPAGASPHSYEPYPDQIKQLEKSSAYIANGYLDFETTWFDRFKSINKNMKTVRISDNIDLLASTDVHHHDNESDDHHHDEKAMDPHFWLSPKNGIIIASAVKNTLIELNPSAAESYEKNFNILSEKIKALDVEADSLFSLVSRKAFVIYHPNL
ncbi:MAG: zinc ABC transporter substrate-binding protein, partial [Bacteroidales bacterium]|nr:zinc ABC transporter substrate-binding protein [Bacteroidales bacterium]